LKKNFRFSALVVAGLLLFHTGILSAAEEAAEATEEKEQMKKELQLADDITKEAIVGPGSVQVQTGKDLLMSFGATVRIIPTSESNWDFGMSENTDGYGKIGDSDPLIGNELFRIHPNESGYVKDGYIRTETKMHFNVMPKDRVWSFYGALEFDRPLDTESVDERGGRSNETSNFGLERLHISYALPWDLRLHAGWDIWHVDAIEAASMVYGDDNPGFWLTGGDDALSYNVGYFKLFENDFQIDPTDFGGAKDADRDLYAGYLTWKPNEGHKLQGFYTFDRIRNVGVTDFLGYLSDGLTGITTAETPDVDSHHLGAWYIGNLGNFELFVEGTYQFGSADGTGLSNEGLAEDYDINAYAFAADLSFEFKGILTDFPTKPHIGIMYTSGDSDPNDDTLGGYNGNVNAQRFSQRWGGENTILGDTNFVYGSALYGYIPEFYGNGTPVFTGGLQNFAGTGNGRGDNPGITMISAGLTVAPKVFLIYKTNVNVFNWNEDIVVSNVTDLLLGDTKVSSGYVGTAWDNEITLATSRHSVLRGQFSWFFPGTVLKDVTAALGTPADDTAMRIAAELIINF
jgi:hypothetical protein